jgi:hypothetical protein
LEDDQGDKVRYDARHCSQRLSISQKIFSKGGDKSDEGRKEKSKTKSPREAKIRVNDEDLKLEEVS